jgi:arsenate reductase (thioredoxin)
MIKIMQDTENTHPIAEIELARYRAAKAAGLKTILFVCSGNSVRSQIAEGLVNHICGEGWAAFSAGIVPIPVPKPLVKVMFEIGIDISNRNAKHINTFRDCEFDRIVVLCSDVDRICPVLPNCKEQDHMIFDDPLSSALVSEGFCFGFRSAFRHLRDDMSRVLSAYMKEM